MTSYYNVNNKKRILSFHFHKHRILVFLLLILLPGFLVPYISGNSIVRHVTIQDVPVTSTSSKTTYSEFDFDRINSLDELGQESLTGLNSRLAKMNPGFDFSDAIAIPMSAGSGEIIQKGSALGALTSTQPSIFYKFNLNDSGPIEITVSSDLTSNKFQFAIDVFTEQYGMPVGSAFDGNPLIFNYYAPVSGTNYVLLNGFDNDFGDNFDIFAGDSASFNVSVAQLKKGTAPKGAESKLLNSIAFDQISDIFSYFSTNKFIDGAGNIDLTRGDPSTGFDVNDAHFFKGLGLSIYGIVRTGDFISNADGKTGQAKLDAVTPYLEMATKLFYLGNASANVKADNGGTNYLYVNPNPGNHTSLTDNVYMLLGIGEIVYQAINNNPGYLTTHQQEITALRDWAFNLTTAVINVFKDATCGNCGTGVYVEDIFGFGTPSESRGDLIKLESNALLAEVFSNLLILDNGSGNFPSALTISEQDNLRAQIDGKLLINDNSNPKMTINLITGSNIGIGVESWNKTSNIKSNTSSLIGNLLYALYRVNTIDQVTFQIDVFGASDITTNILRLFTSPNNGLLYDKALIIDDGTLIPHKISTLENSLFILLAQRLQNKWTNIINNTDISRSWGRKARDHLDSLMGLMYDDVDKAVFGMYDDSAKKLVADDNKPESNRFVANAFLNTILVRVFPVQMGVIAKNNVAVDESSEVSLELSQISLSDALNWFDFIITFKFQLEVTIPEFNYHKMSTVDLADFAIFGPGGNDKSSKFIPISYVPTVKGNFTIQIRLSVEGTQLLSKELELTALGILRAEVSNAAVTAFSTDDSSFTGEFTLVDDQGDAVPNLNVNTSLGLPIDEASNSKYIKSGRSDASGKVAVQFDVRTLINDGIINQTEILSQKVIPNFISIALFINVTNAQSLNLKQAENQLKIRLQVRFAKMNVRTSPSLLEITQGTTETFTFTTTALNQEQNPIANAIVKYSIQGVPGSSNTAFTNVDGEATISLRDNDLFGLSNLVIANNGTTTSTNITLEITHPSYPNKTVTKKIIIEANSLKINANPVQVRTQRGSFFQPNKPSIDVEVATEDLFGKQVVSNVKLQWVDKNNLGLNDIVNLDDLGEHQTPYTFSLDPSNLPEGNHEFMIIARKDGITTTHIIETGSPASQDMNFKMTGSPASQDMNFKSVSGQKIIDRPIFQRKMITIEQSNVLEDAFITIFALMSTFILAFVWNKTKTKSLMLAKVNIECPHCHEHISKKQEVCSHCGRDVTSRKKTAVVQSSNGQIEAENKQSQEEHPEPDLTPQPESADEWPEDDPFKMGVPKNIDEDKPKD